jgi:hypothetical protein
LDSARRKIPCAFGQKLSQKRRGYIGELVDSGSLQVCLEAPKLMGIPLQCVWSKTALIS